MEKFNLGYIQEHRATVVAICCSYVVLLFYFLIVFICGRVLVKVAKQIQNTFKNMNFYRGTVMICIP